MPKHIVRLIGVMVAAIGLGWVAKWYFTADSFYEFGHYRGDSVLELAAQEPVFQTPRYCQSCHNERHAQWSANNHKSVSCEVCHGPAQGHPQKGKLPIPADTAKLCTLCHEAMPERPRTQPQIVVGQHNAYATSGQQCTACHNPHAPKLAGVVAPKLDGDVAAGARKHAAACASCHGAKGLSPNETWPDLAGQNGAYLVRILAAYKSGDQTDVMMSPVAKTLSNADIQNLGVFYAGLSCGTTGKAAAGDAAAGKALADRNCASCHGKTGIGSNAAWPNLAGQKPVFLANTLKAFRAGLRKDPMMAGVVRGLSDADINDLAAYYAGQSCRPTVQAGGTR